MSTAALIARDRDKKSNSKDIKIIDNRLIIFDKLISSF